MPDIMESIEMPDPRDPEPATQPSTTRRDIVKAGAWIVPAVVTLAVTPAFAGVASGEEPPRPIRPQERPGA